MILLPPNLPSMTPLNIFGFIMSIAYVFFGLLVLVSPFLQEYVTDPTNRKIFGAAFLGYGMFRVVFFFRKIREKKS